jgi:predicted nucleotide-binding protein (sugar kinase/HSP70/actin superfamily)
VAMPDYRRLEELPEPATPEQWEAYPNPPWLKRDKKNTTVLYNYVERWKSFFFGAHLARKGYRHIDLGDHVKEDLTWGKEYGNRMECNPMYFTSGSLIRNLMKLHEETGLSKQEIVERYVFLGGGGQCGPCRYGMYPHEYLKVVNEAGFEGFRILIFSSDTNDVGLPPGSAIKFNLEFRIAMLIAIVLADLMHVAECALRPYARDVDQVTATIAEAEQMLYDAFRSRLFLFRIPKVLREVGRMLAAIPRRKLDLPLIFVTGEFFANLAHNDGNYHLRKFISDEGCEVIPGLMTQRILYDNWRRTQEALRGIKYADDRQELKKWKRSLKKQRRSTGIIHWFARKYIEAIDLESFGGRMHLFDLDEMAELAADFYHPQIFGGEGNLEIAEAIHYADTVDGFISVKPFGCMPSSGVSDGVQAKIVSQYPSLNFLSIETSGDNDVSILSRVSMLLFQAKQKKADEAG